MRMESANTDEYHEMLGRRIHHRLETQRHRIPAARRAFYAFLTMAKIGVFGHLGICLFFLASSVPWLNPLPVFGLTLVLVFLLCGATFGKRDGFGIAVGVYHLMILLESLVRWRIGVRFEELASSYGSVCAFLIGAAGYGLMESFVATCFGMSLGLGMASVFCLSRPDDTDYFQDGNPLLRPDLILLVVGSLFGTGFVRNIHTRLFIPGVLGLVLLLLPPASSFVFMCGTVTGFFHGLFLGFGRSLFLTLNSAIKRLTTTPHGRHVLRHCVGLVPGFLVSRCVFGWSLVTSPPQAVAGHVFSAAVLIAVNEIDQISVRILPCLSVSFTSTSSASYSSSTASSSSSPSSSSSSLPSVSASASSTSLSSSSTSTPSATPPKRSLQQRYLDRLLFRPRSGSGSLAADKPTSVLASSASSSTSSSAPLPPRIVVRDFAGHPLYYSAHHVYMAGQCVYVLVFSLLEARRDFRFVLRNLIDWLQSIFLHTGFPDTRVFLVGTHRDHPSVRASHSGSGKEEDKTGEGEGDFVGGVGLRLRKEVPRHFHNMLVWTDRDTPLFPVENSLRDHRDKDHR